MLEERFAEPVREIALDHHSAGLDEVDIAVMDLAERVVSDASSIGDADLQRLRDLGLSGLEIKDVILAASARCFFSKTLDGLGVLADASFLGSTRACARCSSWVVRSRTRSARSGSQSRTSVGNQNVRTCVRAVCIVPSGS